MDARKLAFLDGVADDLASTHADPKANITRIGALGAGLAVGAAFLAMGATPASAAPPAGPAAPATVESCWDPDRIPRDYIKSCAVTSYMKFHYLGSFACGPGGLRSYLRFDRTFHNPCAGDADVGVVSTSCL